jgi:hypothetical protein
VVRNPFAKVRTVAASLPTVASSAAVEKWSDTSNVWAVAVTPTIPRKRP